MAQHVAKEGVPRIHIRSKTSMPRSFAAAAAAATTFSSSLIAARYNAKILDHSRKDLFRDLIVRSRHFILSVIPSRSYPPNKFTENHEDHSDVITSLPLCLCLLDGRTCAGQSPVLFISKHPAATVHQT